MIQFFRSQAGDLYGDLSHDGIQNLGRPDKNWELSPMEQITWRK